jgi:uncharacterized cupin superfamily protein
LQKLSWPYPALSIQSNVQQARYKALFQKTLSSKTKRTLGFCFGFRWKGIILARIALNKYSSRRLWPCVTGKSQIANGKWLNAYQ